MKQPYNSHIQGLINSTKQMHIAHPTLNIYIQVTGRSKNAGFYKLSRNSEGDFILTATEVHLVSEPCMIIS